MVQRLQSLAGQVLADKSSKNHRYARFIAQLGFGDSACVSNGYELLFLEETPVIESEDGVVGRNNVIDRYHDIVRWRVSDNDFTEIATPTIQELADGIRELIGKGRGKPVCWSDGEVAVNARALLNAKKGLLAKKVFLIDVTDSLPLVFLCERDDINSPNWIMILQRNNQDHRKGMWIVED